MAQIISLFILNKVCKRDEKEVSHLDTLKMC